jgi:hypothetical protein
LTRLVRDADKKSTHRVDLGSSLRLFSGQLELLFFFSGLFATGSGVTAGWTV